MFSFELFLYRSAYRAGLSAVSAAEAGISVDNVNAVTLSDALYRTISSTYAATDAKISVNFISHFVHLHTV
jgi:hypothetical protein